MRKRFLARAWLPGIDLAHERPARRGAFDDPTVIDHEGARHEEISHAHTGFSRSAKGCAVLDSLRVEHDDIGLSALLEPADPLRVRRRLLETLRRHQRHLSNSV